MASFLIVKLSINSIVSDSMAAIPLDLVLGVLLATTINHLDGLYRIESTQGFLNRL